MKYKKETKGYENQNLITQLEALKIVSTSIVHQYKIIKSRKRSLTEKETVIHMDFFENYTTKCNKEIQGIITKPPMEK